MARNTSPERGAAAARALVHVPADRRHGLGGKVIGVANAGRAARVGVALPDCRHHFVLLGPTGTGKSTLMLNMALDDAIAGRGMAVFDPAKGDLVTDLLDRLPPETGDRLVIVDPDERKAPPSLNLLDPRVGGGSPHHVAAHVSAVMAKVWSRWWVMACPRSPTTGCSPWRTCRTRHWRTCRGCSVTAGGVARGCGRS